MGTTEQIESMNTTNVEIVYNQITPYLNVATSAVLTNTLAQAIQVKIPYDMWLQSFTIGLTSANISFYMNYGQYNLGSVNSLISSISSLGFNWNSNDYPFIQQGSYFTVYALSSGTNDYISILIQGVKA